MNSGRVGRIETGEGKSMLSSSCEEDSKPGIQLREKLSRDDFDSDSYSNRRDGLHARPSFRSIQATRCVIRESFCVGGLTDTQIMESWNHD